MNIRPTKKKFKVQRNREITLAYVWLQVVDFIKCLLALIRRVLERNGLYLFSTLSCLWISAVHV